MELDFGERRNLPRAIPERIKEAREARGGRTRSKVRTRTGPGPGPGPVLVRPPQVSRASRPPCEYRRPPHLTPTR